MQKFTSYTENALLPDTDKLSSTGEIWREMVMAIDRHIEKETAAAVEHRNRTWPKEVSQLEEKRRLLRRLLGLKDERDVPHLEIKADMRAAGDRTGSFSPEHAGCVGTGPGFRAFAVRWDVFRGVRGDGLLLVPEGECRAGIVALPDCDQTPEMLSGLIPGIPRQCQFARRLAQRGCLVIIPTLIDRGNDFSGLPGVQSIRHPHREVLWRAAYQMGRTLAAYEVQKVLAAIDWLDDWLDANAQVKDRIGVAGYGEGGMVAFFAAALDTRIETAAVSGYFQPREDMWQEPIYRNIWRFLRQYGDAELAALVYPRTLIIEAGEYPEVSHTGEAEKREGIAPGVLTRPEPEEIKREFERARSLVEKSTSSGPGADAIELIEVDKSCFGTPEMLRLFLSKFGIDQFDASDSGSEPATAPQLREAAKSRMRDQYLQILKDTQHLMRESEFTRRQFWKKADVTSEKTFSKTAAWYKDYLWDEIIGRLPPSDGPANPKSRQIYDTETCRGFEVMLDVYDGVFAYGILTVPKNMQNGEKRPVVVCQHGLEGRPQDVANPDVEEDPYNRFAYKLAELGFVTFAPQNPYIGENMFRQVLRRGQPVGLTLFSFIVRQHEKILDWLAGLPIVDSERMAFYGLSYGGKTAMRVPPLLDRYCLSICSADYNEWIWKNVWIRHHWCYLYSSEYDMPEFDLGNTFNYAELSRLIFPRPFMVERGHDDGVAPDEWVAYEFAKTRIFYVKMGMGDRTEIEFFDGPHTINGVGTYNFLQKHLNFSGNEQ